jgi:hypothetical protein
VRAWGRNMVTSGSEGVLQGLDNEWGSRVNGNLRHFETEKSVGGRECSANYVTGRV